MPTEALGAQQITPTEAAVLATINRADSTFHYPYQSRNRFLAHKPGVKKAVSLTARTCKTLVECQLLELASVPGVSGVMKVTLSDKGAAALRASLWSAGGRFS